MASMILPSEITVYTVAELHSAWLGLTLDLPYADRDADFRVDGGGVDDIDASGVQLLMSLRASLSAKGRVLRIVDSSAKLSAACRAIGASILLSGTTAAASPQ